MTPQQKCQLLELVERSLSGDLDEAARTEMNETLRSSPEARTLYAQAMHQHAALKLDGRLTRELAEPVTSMSGEVGATGRAVKSRPLLRVAAAAAVLAAVGVSAWMLPRGGSVKEMAQTGPKTIATVIKARGCKWAGSTLPTAEGSRVTAGTLELAEGIATVKFDSGAEVVMEAPATLELVDAMACRLVKGTLVADVPPSAIGFVVDTPDAKVVDYGTRFGVSAGEDGKYLVQVLEGLVEVNPKSANEPKMLKAGEKVDTGVRASQVRPPQPGQEPPRWQPQTILDAGGGWRVISTAYGRGKDSYIQSSEKSQRTFGDDPYFRVKHSTLAPDLNRRGYIGFDLEKFAGQTIEDAELVLSIEPSDLGFATLVPDSSFAVYGVTDESSDDWDEHGISWKGAPAHDPTQKDRHLPDLKNAVLLGRFHIDQGVSRGTRTLRGQALVDFLRQDTNGIVTFIICRVTDETTRDGLVHAFATKENGSNMPPLLRVKAK